MQNTSEGFDILITVLAMVLLLTVCSWAISSIKPSEEVLVGGRTPSSSSRLHSRAH